ncbi:MAG TPA: uroporphyrinogen-III C-methyltransferase, partial [Methylocystis sp.]|nr:uroporphyrinogen-III C-methyltransferase [Methylocystis sp.]
LEHGADPETPAFLIERASLPDQRIISGTIADLPGKIAGETIKGPALLLFGAALTGLRKLVP